MIRTPETKRNPKWEKAWEEQILPLAKSALEEFQSWPLFEKAGEQWPDAPVRCQRLTSLKAVGKGLYSEAMDNFSRSANPGFQKIYFDLAAIFSDRQQHFYKVWDKQAGDRVVRVNRLAASTLRKRLNWKMSEMEEGRLESIANNVLREHVWEQLHPDAVEMPFHEHQLAILRAGHVPAGFEGNDWKTCNFLYF
jgi:hypothetical protein